MAKSDTKPVHGNGDETQKTDNKSKVEKVDDSYIFSDGYRRAIMNDHGHVTYLDEETAVMLHDNPKFYENLFDSERQTQIPTKMFTWVDEFGGNSGIVVGEPYELVTETKKG